MSTAPDAVGMAWYTPEAWQELCAVSTEHADTYDEFVRRFERNVVLFAAEGVRVVKVPVDVGLMVAWCRKHGYDIDDQKGRAAFGAAMMVARKEGRDVMDMGFKDGTRAEQ